MSTIRHSTLCILLYFSFLFYAPTSFAQLVINELLPNPSGEEKTDEWIELFNTSSQTIDILGYQLGDSASHRFIISSEHLTGTNLIPANAFILVYPKSTNSFSLNNSGSETVFLYNQATESAVLLDQLSYDGSKEDKSHGRIPDGTGNLTHNLIPSPSSPNTPPTPAPTPTPKPTTTPKSTSPPTTKPINTNTSTTPSPIPQKTLSPSLEPPTTSSPSTRSSVLGIGHLSPEGAAPNNSSSPSAQPQSPPASNSAFFFVIAGSLFLGAAGTRVYKRHHSTNF